MKRYHFVVISILIISRFSYGQRGIFFDLEENQKIIRKNFQLLYNYSSKLPLISKKNIELSQLALAPGYLSWVFFNSKSEYINLFKPGNLCRFMELAKNNLINPTDRIIFQVNLDGESEKSKNTYGYFKLKQLETYLINKKECTNIPVFVESFNNKNIQTTIESYELEKPKNPKDCEKLVDKINQDPMVSFFCGIAEEIIDADYAIVKLDRNATNLNSSQKNILNKEIKRGQYLRNKIGDLNASLMGQICRNLENPRKMCTPHLREDIWTKAQNGEFPIEKVKNICSRLIRSEAKNTEDLAKCARIANEVPESCAEIIRETKSGLFPVENCDELSKNKIISILKTDYLDCPSKINNHLLLNAQRIASNIKGLHKKYSNLSCKELPAKVYANISYKYDSESWPLKFCYYDPADADDLKICDGIGIEQICTKFDPDAPLNSSNSAKRVLEKILKYKYNDGIEVNCIFFEKSELDRFLFSSDKNCLVYHEKKSCNFLDCPKTIMLNKKVVKKLSFNKRELRCLSYIPGNDIENELSESRVISEVIKRVYAASNQLTCKIIPEKSYNNVLLKFKQGCFILSPNECIGINCKKRIFYNQKEFKNFQYRGELGENYFEISSQDKIHSMNKKMKKVLEFDEEKILSLTKIKLWFKKDSGIIHGVGCLEDLYPNFFKREQFNQCRATPFLISGTSQKNNSEYVIINTTLDSVSHPRSIRWNNLYNALKMYQNIHPQKLWALYGIK